MCVLLVKKNLNIFLLFFYVSLISCVCILNQLEHGIDVTIKNQDSKTALDLSTADDIKVLLEEAMPRQTIATLTVVRSSNSLGGKLAKRDTSQTREQSTIVGAVSQPIVAKTSDASKETATSSLSNVSSNSVIHLQTITETGDGCMDLDSEQTRNQFNMDQMSVKKFLNRLDESFESLYLGIFEQEKITMEILAEMTSEQLKEIGISAYGARYTIMNGIEKYYKQGM